MKCIHEWRIFGTRMDEEIWNPIRVVEVDSIPEASIICNKCGIEQHAVGYEVLEERLRLDYPKNHFMCTKDVIVKVKEFGSHTLTVWGKNKEIYEWNSIEEQWDKV